MLRWFIVSFSANKIGSTFLDSILRFFVLLTL